MKRFFASLSGLIPFLVHAQLAVVEAPDTTLLSGSMFTNEAQPLEKLAFNRKGIATYNNPSLKEKAQIQLLLADGKTYCIVVEPGKTQRLKLTRGKGGKLQAQYKGANIVLSQLLNELAAFVPEKNAAYEMANRSVDTISFAEAHRRLDERYHRLVKMAGELGTPDERARHLRDVELAYLSNRLLLLSDEDYQHQRDPNEDKRYMALINDINPDDTAYIQRGLIDMFVRSKIPFSVMQEATVGSYGEAYLNAVDAHVHNPHVRSFLMEGLVGAILGQMPANEVESFWAVVKAKAAPEIVQKYQHVVDAQRATKPGVKCPDITFSDAEGKKHHLSDYFGKVLYIALWATWCKPCLAEIPALAAQVEHYKNDNRVQFISISLDKSRAAWLTRLQKDRPQWLQFNANDEENTVISTAFSVMSIPRFILIAADGTVLDAEAFRPSDKDFQKKLEGLLQ